MKRSGALYTILDKLHLTLYWETERTIKKIRHEKDEEKKYKILKNFLTKIAHKMPLDFTKSSLNKCSAVHVETWEDIEDELIYYSDRWNLSRVLTLYSWIDRHELEKIIKE